MENQAERNRDAAALIFDTLGGGFALRRGIDATAMQAIENGAQFSFAGCEFANKVQIVGRSQCVYDVDFWQFSMQTHRTTNVKRYDAVKIEDLATKFTEFTGLKLAQPSENYPPPERPAPPLPSATLKPRDTTKTSLF